MDDQQKQPPSIVCWVHKCNKSVIQLTLGDNDEKKQQQQCRLCDRHHQEPLDFVVKLDYPLVRANQTSFELLIKPMSGRFLTEFGNGSQLHIGIANGAQSPDQCRVLEYDHRGIRLSDGSQWDQCLPLGLAELFNIRAKRRQKVFIEVWYLFVDGFQSDNGSNNDNNGRSQWTAANYDPIHHNCFDFAIDFVRKIGEKLHNSHPSHENDGNIEGNELKSTARYLLQSCDSKEKFCQTFVMSRMKQLARYLALYKKTNVGFIGNKHHNSL